MRRNAESVANLSSLCLGLALFVSYYFLDSGDQVLFWASLAVSGVAMGSILASTASFEHKLSALLLFVGALHVGPMLRGHGAGVDSRLIFARDEGYQMQLDSLVQDRGSWRPDIGLGQARSYSNYPLMPMLAVISFQLLGPRTGGVYFANLLLPILSAILPMIWYVKAINVLLRNNRWALWAGYVFALNEQFLFHDNSFSYETLGIIFFTASIYLLTKRDHGGKGLAVIMIIATTLAHFWTNLNLVVFMTAFYLLPLASFALQLRLDRSDAQVFRPNMSLLVFSVITFVIYLAFVAQTYLRRYGGELVFFLSTIFLPIAREAPGTLFRSELELTLIILGQAILVIFGLIGILSRKGAPSHFLKLTFLVGGAYIVTALFLLPASIARPIIHRTFFFGFFLLAPVVAWTLHKSSSRRLTRLKAMFLVLTLVSVVLIQEPWFRYPNFVADESEVFAANWPRDGVPYASPFISMRSVTDLFGTYGRMNDLGEREPYYSNLSLIFESIRQGNACDILARSHGHYVGLSSSTDEWLIRYYVERYSSQPGAELLKEILQRWSDKSGANRVFNSGPVSLYYLDC